MPITITAPMAMEIARRPRTARRLGYVFTAIVPEKITKEQMEAERRPRAAKKFRSKE
jgi:hypothetical protein